MLHVRAFALILAWAKIDSLDKRGSTEMIIYARMSVTHFIYAKMLANKNIILPKIGFIE